MVMRGDFDLAGGQLLHGMISAVVAEFQLEGLASERYADELMSQANSENWLPSHQAANVVDRVGTGLGISRAVREKYAVGLQRQHVLRRRLRRDYRHLAAFSPQLAQDVLLDAEVIGDYVEARWLIFYADDFVGQVRALTGLPHVGVVGRDDLCEILAIHFRDGARLHDELVRIVLERRDHAAHHAIGPQVAYQRPRVDLGEHRDSKLLHELIRDLLRAPVGTDFRELADDQPLYVRTQRLAVFGIGAVVSDFGVGQDDHLPCVRRVGENFLVAGNGSIKNDFAGALAFSAVAFASEDSAVFEGKDRLHWDSWGWILESLAGDRQMVSAISRPRVRLEIRRGRPRTP